MYENLEKSLLRSKVAEESSTSKNIYIMHIYLNWFMSYSHLKIFRKSHYFSIIFFVWYYFMSSNIINIIINEIYLLIQKVTHMGLILDNEHD